MGEILERKSREKGKNGESMNLESNEHFNVWANKSTVWSEKGTGREKGRERSMENLLGPQDRGKAIQQNNGLLCPTLLPLSQYFQQLQLPLSIYSDI